MLPLIKTCFRIVLLREGPESIPRSWLLAVLAGGLLLYSELAAVALIPQLDEQGVFVSLLIVGAALACYASLLIVAGYGARVLPTLTAMLGAWGVIQVAMVVEILVMMPILGNDPTLIIAQLMLYWSVPVEGHIIARALGRHWYVGIVIAIGVFALKHILYFAVTGRN